MNKLMYMIFLLIYEICLILTRKNKFLKDDITDTIIKIIPIVICIIGALG